MPQIISWCTLALGASAGAQVPRTALLFSAPIACRFTGPLAAAAKSVVALDFMENLIEQNRASNSKYGNIDFR